MKKDKKATPVYRSVMLIDDNEIDNFINQKMIESVNLAENVYVFSGGRSAFEYLRNVIKAGENGSLMPELVFLDIDMPMMDGFQFLEQVASLGPAVSKIKFIILSTSINPLDQEKAEADPRVLTFVNKPLSGVFLESLVSRAGKLTG